MTLIEARDISVQRGGRLTLDGVDLSVAPRSLTALVGPNGSGKSTLLRVLAGIWPAMRGQVLVDGRPLASMSRREAARRIAFLPQDTRCDFAFTVEEAVGMGRYAHRGRFETPAADDRLAIESALDRCDLGPLRGRTLDTLSGGERQRVAIARCLAGEPDIVLLDEPTAHLDLEHALGLMELCRALAASGHAVVLATHDLALAAQHATDALVLREGRAVRRGPLDHVLTPDLYRAVFRVGAEPATAASGRAAVVFSRIDGDRP